MDQMHLDIATLEQRIDAIFDSGDAVVEARINAIAEAAMKEIHSMGVFARRSIGQRSRFARQRLRTRLQSK